MDRGAGNFYIIKVPADRVAKINFFHMEHLKAIPRHEMFNAESDQPIFRLGSFVEFVNIVD